MIETPLIESTLQQALASGGDFADLFVEDRSTTSATYDDGRVEEMRSGRSRGAGIRVVRGDTTGFAHTTDLTDAGLRAAADAAAAAARSGGGVTRVAALEAVAAPSRPAVERPPDEVSKAERVALLERADTAARAESDSIRQVSASYADGRRRILVANSDGVLGHDEQVRTRFAVTCVASGDTGLQTGMDAPGRTMGFEFFDDFAPEDIARRAAAQATVKLTARPAPSGPIPVVLRRGAGGVLFHEACGHGLEADLVGRDASVFRDRVGTRVAGPGVTLIDDGGFERDWGACAIDDEGAVAQRNVLIDDGVLTDYMWDLLRARREGRASTGNGRRETYQHLPMVRMTNTYISPGTEDPDEIIRQTPYGLYCVALGGGQVNPATGDFVFGVTEAYLIENGAITEPVRNAQLIGNGPEALQRVDVVGNDFETWTGMCGKDGQSVPVSSGQPTLRVSELTVGGTAS